MPWITITALRLDKTEDQILYDIDPSDKEFSWKKVARRSEQILTFESLSKNRILLMMDTGEELIVKESFDELMERIEYLDYPIQVQIINDGAEVEDENPNAI